MNIQRRQTQIYITNRWIQWLEKVQRKKLLSEFVQTIKKEEKKLARNLFSITKTLARARKEREREREKERDYHISKPHLTGTQVNTSSENIDHKSPSEEHKKKLLKKNTHKTSTVKRNPIPLRTFGCKYRLYFKTPHTLTPLPHHLLLHKSLILHDHP